MTTTAPERFPAHEAAQGARREALAEIERTWQGIREDIEAERAAAWSKATAHSMNRIRQITYGVEIDDNGELIGWALRCQIVKTKLADEALDMLQEGAGIEYRYQVALQAAEDARLVRRNAFDFSVPLLAVVQAEAAS